REELNIKKVTLVEGELLATEVKPNPKALGTRGLGKEIAAIGAAVAAANPVELAALVAKGEPFTVGAFTLEPGDLWVTQKAPEGWAGAADRNTQAIVDVR